MSISSSSPNPPPPPSIGRLEGALLRRFLRTATIRESRLVGERFRLVTLHGDSLRGASWTPGAKVQVQLGGWAFRTYTPMSWDEASGGTELLLYVHGDGPGAAWTRALEVGHTCSLFGPRDSLDLATLDRPGLLFGDETSFGLVRALRSTPRAERDVTIVLEVTSRSEATAVLDTLGVKDVELVERRPDDTHLQELEDLCARHVTDRPLRSCVLTGRAPSIQRLNRRLRREGLTSRQIRAKAYWAPGKKGLD